MTLLQPPTRLRRPQAAHFTLQRRTRHQAGSQKFASQKLCNRERRAANSWQLFSFRGLDMQGRDDPTAKELSYGFVSCFCSAYLEGDEERCPYRHVVGSRYFKTLDPIRVPRSRRTRRRPQEDSDSD